MNEDSRDDWPSLEAVLPRLVRVGLVGLAFFTGVTSVFVFFLLPHGLPLSRCLPLPRPVVDVLMPPRPSPRRPPALVVE